MYQLYNTMFNLYYDVSEGKTKFKIVTFAMQISRYVILNT